MTELYRISEPQYIANRTRSKISKPPGSEENILRGLSRRYSEVEQLARFRAHFRMAGK